MNLATSPVITNDNTVTVATISANAILKSNNAPPNAAIPTGLIDLDILAIAQDIPKTTTDRPAIATVAAIRAFGLRYCNANPKAATDAAINPIPIARFLKFLRLFSFVKELK